MIIKTMTSTEGNKKILGHREKVVTEENNILDIKKIFEGKRFTFLKQRLEYNNVCRELHRMTQLHLPLHKKKFIDFFEMTVVFYGIGAFLEITWVAQKAQPYASIFSLLSKQRIWEKSHWSSKLYRAKQLNFAMVEIETYLDLWLFVIFIWIVNFAFCKFRKY